MKFTLKITQENFKKAYQHALGEAVQNTLIKGFRKGHAPNDLVIKQVGEGSLVEHALNHALPEAYIEEIKKRKLVPLTNPRFKPVTTAKDQDWEFEVEIGQRPQVTLGDYQKAIKGLGATAKIWTPAQGKPDTKPEDKSQDEAQRLNRLFDALLKTAKLEIPSLLLEEEVNHMLTSLLDQVSKLGMKIEDYARAKNTTVEAIKAQYHSQAEANLKLEFILQEITKDLKIAVSQADLDAVLKDVTDKKAHQQLESPEEQSRIRAVLARRKTIDRLLSLSA